MIATDAGAAMRQALGTGVFSGTRGVTFFGLILIRCSTLSYEG